MKKTHIIASLALLALAACQPEVRQLKFTDVGPEVTIQSVDGSAYMGGEIAFSVNVTDAEFTLSTLKVDLLYDESVVNTLTIRTREYGVYEGTLGVPLYAGIPDGIATLRFTAQNTGLGTTVVNRDVEVSRPNFDHMYITVDGKEVAMDKDRDWHWSVTGSFPADASSLVRTPVVNDRGDVISFGWDGSAVAVSDTPIPFKMGAAGVYTIEVDLWDLTASPLGKDTIDLSGDNPTAVYNLVPDTSLQFPNISAIDSWDLDYDFFKLTGSDVTFTAVAGMYKLSADFSRKWIKVEAMEDESTLASLGGENADAVWCIGSNFGKPVTGPSWNTTDGAYCCAQVAPGIHQFSLVYGTQLSSGFSIKFFHQKGWGGEFRTYASVNDETGLFNVTTAGNIEAASGAQLETGMGYRFTIDTTPGADQATLDIKAVKLVEGLSISVNGVRARGAGDVYKVSMLELAKGEGLTITGDAGLTGFTPDPDFMTADGKFNAVDGNYSVELHLDASKKNVEWARFSRVDAEGNNVDIESGGCYIQGGNFSFFKHSSTIGWPGTGGLQMAQVSPGIYQVSGYAVDASDGTTPYGRWETDAMNVKYFYQDGWKNGDYGGEASTVRNITERAAQLLDLERGDPGNIYLKEGVTLEEGAMYVLTVDFTGCTFSNAGMTSGVETIDFYKK